MEELLHEKPYVERLDGKAHPKPLSPKGKHGIVQGTGFSILRRCGAGFGIAATEWDFHVGAIDGTATMLVPDVAFVSLARLHDLPEAQRESPPFAPDVAVEIRSSSFRSPIAAEKIARYLRTGALLVLDVDPVRRTVTAHASTGTHTFSHNETFKHEAVPWLVFEVAELFCDLDLLYRS